MRAKLVNEGLWDKDNLKAVAGYTDMYDKRPKNDYTFVVEEPFILKTDNDKDAANLEYIFNKYRIKHQYDENKK